MVVLRRLLLLRLMLLIELLRLAVHLRDLLLLRLLHLQLVEPLRVAMRVSSTRSGSTVIVESALIVRLVQVPRQAGIGEVAGNRRICGRVVVRRLRRKRARSRVGVGRRHEVDIGGRRLVERRLLSHGTGHR